MKALALSFDGVLSDSAPEAYVAALRTYCELKPGSCLGESLDRLVGDGQLTRGRVVADPRFAAFVEHLPLGSRAGDLGLTLSILERGLTIREQVAYDRMRREEPATFLWDFHRRFYEIRDELSTSDPEGWRALFDPHPGLPDLLRRRASDRALAILTERNRRSVGLLLREHGVEDLFPDERVMDSETGPTPVAHLRSLQRELRIASTQITFVDSGVRRLDAVFHLGVKCVLATWGHNGPREQDHARERGYQLCSLEDAEAQLFD